MVDSPFNNKEGDLKQKVPDRNEQARQRLREVRDFIMGPPMDIDEATLESLAVDAGEIMAQAEALLEALQEAKYADNEIEEEDDDEED